MITNQTVVALCVIVGLCVIGLILWNAGNKAQTKREKRAALAKRLHVEFNEGLSLTFDVVNCYHAQQILNRFTWAGVKEAFVVVGSITEYEADETGLLVYIK